MSYTTDEDIKTAAGGAVRLDQLADFDRDGVADADKIATAQAQADGWIDANLRKFSPADLARLRAAPTATIKRLAASEVIFILREWRQGIAADDLTLREQRIAELKEMRADQTRPDDVKSPRGSWVENDSDFSTNGFKGSF